ncbi:hypothetical protein HDV00_003763 [Rhizophlyctis rosea]|nr:hypothetical protein HDV00_003763 [Rhizophlyctis rosea]
MDAPTSARRQPLLPNPFEVLGMRPPIPVPVSDQGNGYQQLGDQWNPEWPTTRPLSDAVGFAHPSVSRTEPIPSIDHFSASVPPLTTAYFPTQTHTTAATHHLPLPSVNIPIPPNVRQHFQQLQTYASHVVLPPSPESTDPPQPLRAAAAEDSWRNIVGISLPERDRDRSDIGTEAGRDDMKGPVEGTDGYNSISDRPTSRHLADSGRELRGGRRRSTSSHRKRRSSVARIQSRLDQLNDEEAQLLREMEELNQASDEDGDEDEEGSEDGEWEQED